jgi:mannose-6-phosphate isomerase
MHLLEAWLALGAATGEGQWLDRADAIVELFHRRFYDQLTQTLGEYFGPDWSVAPGRPGQIIEPGHHYEWAWLLDRYAQANSAADGATAGISDQLYAFATTYGVDADGLVFDSVLRDGTLHDGNKRLWVQTEAIKAAASRYERIGDMTAAARVDALLELLFNHYLDGVRGDYVEHLNRQGTSFKSFAPASSLYHVFLALTEVLRVFGGDTK